MGSDYMCYFDASLYTVIIYNDSDSADNEKTMIIPINTFNELRRIRDHKCTWLKEKVRTNIDNIYKNCKSYKEFKNKIDNISIVRGDGKDIYDFDMSFFTKLENGDLYEKKFANFNIWKYNLEIIIANIEGQIRSVISKDTDYLVYLLNKYMKEITIFNDSNVPDCHFV